jgi:hypothetical protein
MSKKNNNNEQRIKIKGLILRELLQFEENNKQQILFNKSFNRKKRKRWIKCWGIIKDGGLFEIYSDQKVFEFLIFWSAIKWHTI